MPRPMKIVAPVFLLLLLSGCGGGRALQATREDGSDVDLRGHARAWCGAEDPSEPAAGQPRALHLVLGPFPPRGADPRSYLFVSHRLSELRRSGVITVGEDEDLASVYIFDSKTFDEAASNLAGAHGTVRFRDVSCHPGGQVRVLLDAVLVSENGKGGDVHVRGELRAPIASK